MTEREVLSVADQISVVCYQAGHEHCSGVLRLWRGGEGPCECACHRSTENNLGISGDAHDALELAGRGVALVGTLLHVIEEEKATVERLQAITNPKEQQ